MSKDTLFTNDGSAGSGSSQYVQEVLQDFTVPASTNSGLTDTAATNPLSQKLGNDDTPRFGSKTLWIKDYVLIDDRSKWVNGKATYRVLFDESFFGGFAYMFGDFNAVTNLVSGIGDGFGITGVYRRIQFIVEPSTQATATAQVVVDGVNGNTIDFSSSSAAGGNSYYVHASTNVSKDLHDFRLTALQAGTLKILGVVVYWENSGQNIEVFPGNTYVNKTRSSTSSGATMSVPSYGSSLGGVATIYKLSVSGYTVSSVSATTIASVASGSSGSNLLTVSTGAGASFSIGYGLVMTHGSSVYIGNVTSVSTDTLTMGVTLGFGTSTTASIYTAWKSGYSLAISSTIMSLDYYFNPASYTNGGVSSPIFESQQRFCVWGSNLGITNVASTPCIKFFSNSGFMQVDGYMSAAEFEFVGAGIFHATISINGIPGWGINTGQTGPIRRTIFTDAGPGWNTFTLQCGSSMGSSLGISRINFYNRSRDQGVSYGVLAQMDTLQAYTPRSAQNCTLLALGTYQRTYADQLYLKGGWVRGVTTSACGGVIYYGSTTNCSIRHEYYGKNFALVGTAGTGNMTLDGVSISPTFNVMQTASSEGFHTVTYTVTGGTAIIEALDIVRSTRPLNNLQKGIGDI